MTPAGTLELAQAVLIARASFTPLVRHGSDVATILESLHREDMAARLLASLVVLDDVLAQARELSAPGVPTHPDSTPTTEGE